jgi:hypothetical protein
VVRVGGGDGQAWHRTREVRRPAHFHVQTRGARTQVSALSARSGPPRTAPGYPGTLRSVNVVCVLPRTDTKA